MRINDQSLLFLDFDGVICDSLDECIISSFYAYFKLLKKTEPLSLFRQYKEKFSQLRPFVRDGEDYLVIQYILEHDIHINNQQHFDEMLHQHREKMIVYKELFYKARTRLLQNDPDFWFYLNKIYPHLLKIFSRACASSRLYILSTKRADFILSILKSNNILIREEQVHVAWGVKKMDLISSILDTQGISRAIFVDDQISHLKGNTDPRITPYLASWGYIQEEWLGQSVKIMNEEEICDLLETY